VGLILNSVKRFGLRLKEIREERNLTTRQLAEMFSTTAPTISRYENGVHDPKRVFIQQVANTFGINPAWLAGENVDKYVAKIKPCVKIPIIGTIAAGAPILAQENFDGYEWACEDNRVDFCLRVKGNSMTGARIYDGDIVYIRKQEEVENGEIAAVVIDNEATLKRVYRLNGGLILRSENPEQKEMIFSKKDLKDVRIVGKAIMLKGVVR
jgi:repressor LexA